MDIIPIEYCEISGEHIHLNQSIANCAFEHNCGEAEFIDCPLRQFFSKQLNNKRKNKQQKCRDMPKFYISDL